MTFRNSKYVLLAIIAISSALQAYSQEKLSNPTQESLTWTEFISEEGGFRVLMPERPKLEVFTYESGENRWVHKSFTVDKGPFIWLVDYADLPTQRVDSTNTTAFFNEMRDQLLSEVKGTLQHQTPLSLAGYSGLEIKLQAVSGKARVRLYLVNNRLYQLVVSRLDLLSTSEEPMEKFLNSFKIIDGRTPRTAMQRSIPQASQPLIHCEGNSLLELSGRQLVPSARFTSTISPRKERGICCTTKSFQPPRVARSRLVNTL